MDIAGQVAHDLVHEYRTNALLRDVEGSVPCYIAHRLRHVIAVAWHMSPESTAVIALREEVLSKGFCEEVMARFNQEVPLLERLALAAYEEDQ